MERLSIHGRIIVGKAFKETCGECGMGLLAADEFHPFAACEIFKRTHDSGEVERALSRLWEARA